MKSRDYSLKNFKGRQVHQIRVLLEGIFQRPKVHAAIFLNMAVWSVKRAILKIFFSEKTSLLNVIT